MEPVNGINNDVWCKTAANDCVTIACRLATIWREILTGENIDEFDKFSAIRQYFPYQTFPFNQLATYP